MIANYEKISLGMSRQQATEVVEGSAWAGCGAYHSENRETVCRFEDAWRGYRIDFDPGTKLVVRKHFHLKSFPGFNPARN
jgi:hypothetical protein